jgi:hypothetical protein
MSHINITPKTNKNIANGCHGFACFCEATNYIDEEVGDIGTISLQLCDDCFAKFRKC